MGDAVLINTMTPCGGKGGLLTASEKPGDLGDYMNSWGPLASHKQRGP